MMYGYLVMCPIEDMGHQPMEVWVVSFVVIMLLGAAYEIVVYSSLPRRVSKLHGD